MSENQIPMDVELTDGTILIRLYKQEDIPIVFEAVCESIPEVSAWLEWCHADYKIEETEDYIVSRPEAWTKDEEYSFAIFDVATDKFLGGIGLNLINRRFKICNLGYWIRTSETGRSIASKATKLAGRFALTELGLNRVEIVAAVGNLASQRAAEKAGALREGIIRKALPLHGKIHDCILFSLIAEDFEKMGKN
jgi:RimJ/RimL family protein N-acetyltransferase